MRNCTGRQGRRPIGATAPLARTRSRWSLDSLKKSTIFEVSSRVSTRAVTSCLLLFGLFCSPAGRPALAEPTLPRPNIVVILVDDLRWDELGCAGHPFVKTPHIDRIAREGTMAGNAFATTPLCSPVRASLLTGLYPHSHGIIDNTNRSAQSHRLKTFPGVLQRAGYETGYVGKWHMGNDCTRRPGFDYWVSIKGQGSSNDPEINENGHMARVPGYITDIFNERALAFIKRKRTRPFFLYVAHKAIHPELTQRDDGSISDPAAGRFIPATRHQNLYAGVPIPRRPSVGRRPQDKPALMRTIGDLPPLGPDTGTTDEQIRNRLRMLAAVDEGLGQVFEALREAGQLDDTVLVFTSDHGYFNGEHGLSVERRLAYEEAVRIPLLVRYPRVVKPGSTFDQIALSIDLAPTLLQLAGVAAEGEMHGRSLVPLLQGETRAWRKSFLIEYYSDTVFPRVLAMGYKAVRTERFKYIHYVELKGMDELYDLQSDPYEMENLVNEPGSQETLRRMKSELARLSQQTR